MSRVFLALAVVIAASAPAEAGSTAKAIRYVQSRMVKIFGSGGFQRLAGYGTGFLVSAKGHIVTVWSPVLDGDTVNVILDDGRKFQAKVIGAEPTLDMAVLKIQSDTVETPFFKKEDFASGDVGTRILGFSNMFKVANGDEPVSVLHGVISAKTKLTGRKGAFEVPYDGAVYIVDAITNNPGAGGGVITTRSGKLLGMIGKEIRDSRSNIWINYSVPITALKDVIEAIVEGKYIEIGKKKEDKDNPRNYFAKDFGLIMVPDVIFRTPAYVDQVIAGSQGQKLKLEPDDLIVFINDDLIQSVRMLNDSLGRLEGGDTVRVVVRRGNKLVTIVMEAEKKPENKTP